MAQPPLRRVARVAGVVGLVISCASSSGRDDDLLGSVSGGAPLTGATGEDESGSTSDEGDDTTTGAFDGVAESSDDDVTGSESTTAGPVEPPTGVCAPNPTDAPCTACSKTNCCSQLQACSSDPDCQYYMTCVYQSADAFGCGTQCGVDLFAPGPVGDLVSCSAGPCGASCVG